MIKVKPKDLGLAVANQVEVNINGFKTNSTEISVKVLLYSNDTPIMNHDGGTIGINLRLPESVLKAWKTDDTVVEDFVLAAIGFERA